MIVVSRIKYYKNISTPRHPRGSPIIRAQPFRLKFSGICFYMHQRQADTIKSRLVNIAGLSEAAGVGAPEPQKMPQSADLRPKSYSHGPKIP